MGGYKWVLLFRQVGARYPKSLLLDHTPQEYEAYLSVNSQRPNSDIYSQLDVLRGCSHEADDNWTDVPCEWRDSDDGKLTFKMVFPHRTDTPNYNVWKQTTNPVGMARGQ